MANLARGADDRGQLLIIAAVGFTVVLIALALALNTAVYANVHVPQTDSSSYEERSAIQYQNSVQRGLSGFFPVTGENETEDELREQFTDEVELWENLTRDQYARDGVATNLSVESVTFEVWRVVQDDTQTFENRTGSSDWTVASAVSQNASFDMTIHSESLAPDENTSFTTEVVGANSSSWTLSSYSTNASEIVVDINGDREFETNASSIQIDLANGTFNASGTETSFTSFVEDDSIDPPYEIRYKKADQVTGTYEIVADELAVDRDNYAETGSPRADLQIVASTVSVSYQSSVLQYRTDIQVRTGETDD